jgi:hypothetical protein
VNARIARIIGLCTFAAAFFLPAVKERDDIFTGWQCAYITLVGQISDLFRTHFDLGGLLQGIPFLIDGWVNPLVILYLLLLGFHLAKVEFRGLTQARRVVAYAVLICIADCWIIMFSGLTPLIGHFLWVGGILLMISPEFFDLSKIRLRNLPPTQCQ